jgi:hypothetical protein
MEIKKNGERDVYAWNGTGTPVPFQAVSVFVWVSALILLVCGGRVWIQGQYGYVRMLLPIIHVGPWATAFLARRRYLASPSRGEYSQESARLLDQTIPRILWATYIALVTIEYSLYH